MILSTAAWAPGKPPGLSAGSWKRSERPGPKGGKSSLPGTHGADYSASREGRYLPVPHCRQGTPGWELHPDLAPFADKIFDKPGFGSTGLVEYIRAGGYGRVEFVGLCTDICVVTNALMVKGALPELDVAVDAACCAGVTPESHEAALLTMKMCQIDV